jgi:hypothetical protein
MGAVASAFNGRSAAAGWPSNEATKAAFEIVEHRDNLDGTGSFDEMSLDNRWRERRFC